MLYTPPFVYNAVAIFPIKHFPATTQKNIPQHASQPQILKFKLARLGSQPNNQVANYPL